MPETNTPAERNRLQIGIALAGGGPLGGIYEVGALMALDEALRGFRLTDSGVFVGVSSGAFFASGLANGLSPRAMHRMFIESDKDDDPFEPEVLLKPAFGEYGRRIAAIPRLLTSGLADYLRGGHNRKAAASLRRLVQALPAGLFDSAPLQAYLRRLASSRGFPDDFRKLRRKLYIVATDLDSSELVTFGSPGWDDVPISSAVQASAALPGLFPPVKINGRYYVDGALQRTLNASVALKDGVKLLFAFNPIVPYKADPPAGRDGTESLANGGLLAVLSQTFRSLIHSRMKVGMERYRHIYPGADIVLIEPRQDDGEMFFVNVFSYADRRRLCEHAYQQTRADLLRRAGVLKPILARHGLILDEAVLRDPKRTLLPQAAENGSSLQSALQTLTETLGRLEPLLQKPEEQA
ncbi:MAG: patatin-like phospholipase family protein [Rhodomicrobium sp.]